MPLGGRGRGGPLRELEEALDVLPVVLPVAALETLLQPLGWVEGAPVVGDGDVAELQVGQLGLVLQPGPALGRLQFGEAEPEAAVEIHPTLFQEVVGIGFEMLQVVLEDAIASAEFLWVRRGAPVGGDELGHLDQGEAADGEHRLATRVGSQLGLVFGKGLAPPVGGCEVDGVADTELEHPLYRKTPPQGVPQVTGLLTGDGGEQVGREGGAGNGRIQFSLELPLEPGDCIAGGD